MKNPCASSENISVAIDFSGETTTKKWGTSQKAYTLN